MKITKRKIRDFMMDNQIGYVPYKEAKKIIIDRFKDSEVDIKKLSKRCFWFNISGIEGTISRSNTSVSKDGRVTADLFSLTI